MASELDSSASMNSVGIKALVTSAAKALAGAGEDKRAQTVTTVVDAVAQALPDKLVEVEAKSETKTNFENFARSTAQAEAAKKINSEKTLTKETTIGRSPDVDWRSWAQETVREKPMPISYKLPPLTDLMCYKQFVAFENALRNIYGQYIGAGSSANEYPLDMHFGVFRGDGEDVSFTPFDQRVILQSKPPSAPFYLYPRTKGNPEQFSIDVLGYGLTWRGKPARPLPDMFATLIHGGIGQVEEEENEGFYFDLKKLYTEGGLVSAASSTSSTSTHVMKTKKKI